jgi:uncharacterized protein (TIGR00645 family)
VKPHGCSFQRTSATRPELDLREPLAAAAAVPRPDHRPGHLRLVVLQELYYLLLAAFGNAGALEHVLDAVTANVPAVPGVERPTGLNETVIMLVVLGLIDVVMISNLLIMVIVGGYETFVSRMNLEGHPDQPEWLSHVNASVLKVKLATAIIGISSIHLLKTFINAHAYDEKTILAQVGIHITFLLSAMAIGASDRLMPHGSSRAEEHV